MLFDSASGEWKHYCYTFGSVGILNQSTICTTGMIGLEDYGCLARLSNGTILFEFMNLAGTRVIYKTENLNIVDGQATWELVL